MRGAQHAIFDDFSGGLDVARSVYLIENRFARDARNVQSTLKGQLLKRDGTQVWSTLGSNSLSLYPSLSPRFLIAGGTTVLYSINPSKTVTTIKTGMAAARWSWINAPANGGQGPLYGVNGTDIQQWDGAAASTSAWTASAGTLPSGAKYLLVRANRVLAAGMASYAGAKDPTSMVAASAVGAPRDWSTASGGWQVEFAPNDGEAITAITPVGPYVLVSKPSKCWLIYDLDTGANRPLSEAAGAVSHRAAMETPLGTVFLTKDQGVLATSGSSFKRLSERILPLLQTIPAARKGEAAMAFWNNKLYLAVSLGSGTNDTLFEYDVNRDAWWAHSLGSSDLAVWEPSAGQQTLYDIKAGAATNRQLLVPGLTLDDVAANGTGGSAYTSYWRGPFHTFGAPELRKRVRQIRLDGKGRVRLGVTKDFQRVDTLLRDQTFGGDSGSWGVNDGSLWGVDDGTYWGGLADIQQARIPTPGVARSWSVSLLNDTSDALEIDSYILALSKRED